MSSLKIILCLLSLMAKHACIQLLLLTFSFKTCVFVTHILIGQQTMAASSSKCYSGKGKGRQIIALAW